MKKKRTNILIKILITLCIIAAIFTGGYFFLDKLIVPKYFSSYGINGMGDLVGVVTSLYKSPKEADIVKKPYTEKDLRDSIDILIDSGYKLDKNGEMIEKDFNEFKKDASPVELTDRQFAALCNKLISTGILVNTLPNLKYLNVLNITLLEMDVEPNLDKPAEDGEGYLGANIGFIIKINTVDIREQIAKQMDTPIFLLNMIIPDTLYFTVNYDIDLTDETTRSNATIAINGRTEKQSEILINLLIEFIFPEEDKMNATKFTEALSDILSKGIDVFGDCKFVDGLGEKGLQNGILLIP